MHWCNSLESYMGGKVIQIFKNLLVKMPDFSPLQFLTVSVVCLLGEVGGIITLNIIQIQVGRIDSEVRDVVKIRRT